MLPPESKTFRAPPVTRPSIKPPPRSSGGGSNSGRSTAECCLVSEPSAKVFRTTASIYWPKKARRSRTRQASSPMQGNELRGFGNLLLIKHSGGWISAYAHNSELLFAPDRRSDEGRSFRKWAVRAASTSQRRFRNCAAVIGPSSRNAF